eukprot:TRINITY_DN1191_c0_g1_i8.p1 TRINITY_DN1191_c0_g1~~TRINITY_DN1191_c0_g1_i8.p1  ORF type:complete len:280 (-),score=-18.59 TRINITY_DN1191_c0_g1_i8:583-1422(-)
MDFLIAGMPNYLQKILVLSVSFLRISTQNALIFIPYIITYQDFCSICNTHSSTIHSTRIVIVLAILVLCIGQPCLIIFLCYRQRKTFAPHFLRGRGHPLYSSLGLLLFIPVVTKYYIATVFYRTFCQYTDQNVLLINNNLQIELNLYENFNSNTIQAKHNLGVVGFDVCNFFIQIFNFFYIHFQFQVLGKSLNADLLLKNQVFVINFKCSDPNKKESFKQQQQHPYHIYMIVIIIQLFGFQNKDIKYKYVFTTMFGKIQKKSQFQKKQQEYQLFLSIYL